MAELLRKLWKEKDGRRMAEYIVIVLIIAFAGIIIVSGCGDDSKDAIDCTCSTLAEVAEQTGFWIGAAIADPEGDLEQKTIGVHFNSVTAENAMKWGSLAPSVGQYDFQEADALVDFADERGVRIRGHVLVWRNQQPADLEAEVLGADDPEARLRAILAEHIEAVAGRYSGQVDTWDVVNEPMEQYGIQIDNNLFYQYLGEEYIDESFSLARAADPQARLFLNEYFYVHNPTDERVVAFHALVKRLLERGVPIDGVGIQGHFWGILGVDELPARTAFEEMLRSFTELGLEVEITEMDVSRNYFPHAEDPFAEQAQVYADVFAACRAVPDCIGVTTWGMSDINTWLDRNEPFSNYAPHHPLLLDTNLQPKPAYYAVCEVLLGCR
ncbi:MAG: endo-1,4-beta-xylanase [Deltaproteobacteria bacterium]|nr:MAG: endo-1,4-beta-xylanase [Deltaproteobacteria bacterium]